MKRSKQVSLQAHLNIHLKLQDVHGLPFFRTYDTNMSCFNALIVHSS